MFHKEERSFHRFSTFHQEETNKNICYCSEGGIRLRKNKRDQTLFEKRLYSINEDLIFKQDSRSKHCSAYELITRLHSENEEQLLDTMKIASASFDNYGTLTAFESIGGFDLLLTLRKRFSSRKIKLSVTNILSKCVSKCSNLAQKMVSQNLCEALNSEITGNDCDLIACDLDLIGILFLSDVSIGQELVQRGIIPKLVKATQNTLRYLHYKCSEESFQKNDDAITSKELESLVFALTHATCFSSDKEMPYESIQLINLILDAIAIRNVDTNSQNESNEKDDANDTDALTYQSFPTRQKSSFPLSGTYSSSFILQLLNNLSIVERIITDSCSIILNFLLSFSSSDFIRLAPNIFRNLFFILDMNNYSFVASILQVLEVLLSDNECVLNISQEMLEKFLTKTQYLLSSSRFCQSLKQQVIRIYIIFMKSDEAKANEEKMQKRQEMKVDGISKEMENEINSPIYMNASSSGDFSNLAKFSCSTLFVTAFFKAETMNAFIQVLREDTDDVRIEVLSMLKRIFRLFDNFCMNELKSRNKLNQSSQYLFISPATSTHPSITPYLLQTSSSNKKSTPISEFCSSFGFLSVVPLLLQRISNKVVHLTLIALSTLLFSDERELKLLCSSAPAPFVSSYSISSLNDSIFRSHSIIIQQLYQNVKHPSTDVQFVSMYLLHRFFNVNTKDSLYFDLPAMCNFKEQYKYLMDDKEEDNKREETMEKEDEEEDDEIIQEIDDQTEENEEDMLPQVEDNPSTELEEWKRLLLRRRIAHKEFGIDKDEEEFEEDFTELSFSHPKHDFKANALDDEEDMLIRNSTPFVSSSLSSPQNCLYSSSFASSPSFSPYSENCKLTSFNPFSSNFLFSSSNDNSQSLTPLIATASTSVFSCNSQTSLLFPVPPQNAQAFTQINT